MRGAVVVAEDVTAIHEAQSDRARLATAIDQAAESIVVTDPDGRIVYTNPAFEQVTGYTRAELLGQNPRVLKSGAHDASFYDAMWATLLAGRTWRGLLVNRRKDGSHFEEEAAISPVRDAAGRTTAYVAVKRDLTAERALEAGAAGRAGRPGRRPEAISAITVGGRRRDSGIRRRGPPVHRRDRVPVRLPPPGARRRDYRWPAACPLARGPGGSWSTRRSPLPARTSGRRGVAPPLRERAAAGPRRDRHRARGGLTGGVYAPVLVEGRLVAVIGGLTTRADASDMLARRLRCLLEIAAHVRPRSGASWSSETTWRVAGRRSRDRGHGRFHPVFQPIVRLADHSVIGYEALTRFDDGVAPTSGSPRRRRSAAGSTSRLRACRPRSRPARSSRPGRG